MTGFPILMYYLWTCLWFYDGHLVYPHSIEEAKPLFLELWDHVRVVRPPFQNYVLL
jgi:delta24(24(1))-sterol reductase